jgi:hypothetical protein
MSMTQISPQGEKGNLSVAQAIIIGHLVTTVPVVAIIFGFRWIGLSFFGGRWWIALIIGFLVAWFWWAYVEPRWRKWAVQKGAPARRLHQIAVATGLEWSKGSVFENTEIKTKDNE